MSSLVLVYIASFLFPQLFASSLHTFSCLDPWLPLPRMGGLETQLDALSTRLMTTFLDLPYTIVNQISTLRFCLSRVYCL